MVSFVYVHTPLQDMVWCVWRRLFELACPGCGLTRSFCAMSAGEWGAAFEHHMAGPLLYGAMVWCIFAWAIRFVSGPAQWMSPGRTVLSFYWGATLLMYLGQVGRIAMQWTQ